MIYSVLLPYRNHLAYKMANICIFMYTYLYVCLTLLQFQTPFYATWTQITQIHIPGQQ